MTMTHVLLVVLGILIGALVTAVMALVARQRQAALLGESRSRAMLLDEQARRQVGEIAEVRGELLDVNREREAAERRIAALDEQLRAREAQFIEQRQLLEDAQTKLTDTFGALGAQALQANNEQFLALAKKAFEALMTQAKGDVDQKQQAIDAMVKPIRELLEKHNTAVGALETKRETAYATLDQKIAQIAAAHDKLGSETTKLVNALRRPEVRGRWGEVQLENVVELAGMSEHCDFRKQVTVGAEEGRLRPDLLVSLPGGGVIPVDSKVPLDAYLGAMQPDADRAAELKRHARHVQEHVNRLADKNYAAQFERTPGVVVLFIPLESALTAALEVNPKLHAEAMQRHVLIATPTLLVAVLRAVAYGWQQEAIARNAREIADVGRALHDRLSVFVSHFEKIGAHLRGAGESYNKAVGSLERNVLSGARKLKALRATEEPDIETPDAVENEIRPITAAELRQIARADDDESNAQARRLAAEQPLIDLMKLETDEALEARP